MSTYQIAIPLICIDEDEFVDLLNRLAKVAGKPFEAEKQMVVSTDDAYLYSMFTSLTDAIRNQVPAADVVRKNGHAKTAKTRKKLGGGKRSKKQEAARQEVKHEPTRGPHVRSIKIESTGEMISRFELDKRLSERTIDPGSQLHSPKHGTMTVRNNVPPGAPYVLINLVGEVISKGGDAQKG